jgi:hypothetical protein
VSALLLADTAPGGAGLAIVALILLAFVAVVVGGAIWLTVFLVRRSRGGREPSP